MRILVVALLLVAILGWGYLSYALLMEKWEYRAVYHYDCASYLTES